MTLIGWIIYSEMVPYMDDKVYLDKGMAEKKVTEKAVEYNLGRTGYAMFRLKQIEIVPVEI